MSINEGTLARIERDWTVILERLAKEMHNSHMADNWDDLPLDGIERAIWLQTAGVAVKEMQSIMDEWKQ